MLKTKLIRLFYLLSRKSENTNAITIENNGAKYPNIINAISIS